MIGQFNSFIDSNKKKQSFSLVISVVLQSTLLQERSAMYAMGMDCYISFTI
jgi:hypothetical protein